jgi:CRP/FNR family transcriptional regulator, cyclic AMP receptor protein
MRLLPINTLKSISSETCLGAPPTLDQIPLFAGLGQRGREVVARHASIKALSKGTLIIVEGSETQALYIIVEGSVKIYLTNEEGKEIVLRTQRSGEYFGELSLLDDDIASASVMALEDSRCVLFSKQSFNRLCDDYPAIRDRLLKGLSVRVRQLTDEVRCLALMDVYQRIVHTLRSLAIRQDNLLVVERLTHQAIADRVCASREMVSRILKNLSAGGYLKFEKDRIVIVRKLPASR